METKEVNYDEEGDSQMDAADIGFDYLSGADGTRYDLVYGVCGLGI